MWVNLYVSVWVYVLCVDVYGRVLTYEVCTDVCLYVDV